MSYKDEVRAGASAVVWVIVGVALLFAVIGAGWWLFQRPNIDRGYSHQVNGLVTAWCTATTPMDKAAARGDIIGEKNSAPARWNRMTVDSRTRAQQVINNDEGVCL